MTIQKRKNDSLPLYFLVVVLVFQSMLCAFFGITSWPDCQSNNGEELSPRLLQKLSDQMIVNNKELRGNISPLTKEKVSPVPKPTNLHHHQDGLSSQALNTWCPTAQCQVTDLCHPCRRRYVVIVATGRSGSSTLQRMLESLPGIRMSGENNGMLTHFQHAVHATTASKEWHKGILSHRHPWNHLDYPSSAFACVTQQMIETINPPPNVNGSHVDPQSDRETIVGFKTIRFPEERSKEGNDAHGTTTSRERATDRMFQAAQFLNETLPCSKIIVNIRSDTPLQAASMLKAFGKHETWLRESSLDHVVNVMNSRNHDLMDLADWLGPNRARIMDSSQWTSNISLINELVSWMGFEDACHFDRLFEYNTNHVYGHGDETSRRNPSGCLKLPP